MYVKDHNVWIMAAGDPSTGALLGEPFRPRGGNFQDLDVRPDGEVFAYTTYESYGSDGFIVAPTLNFAYADGRDFSHIANAYFDRFNATYDDNARTVLAGEIDDNTDDITLGTLAPGEPDGSRAGRLGQRHQQRRRRPPRPARHRGLPLTN